MKQTFAVLYTDQGPSGPCAASCQIMNPWTWLYLFETEEKMRQFLLNMANNGKWPDRRKSRVEILYPHDHEYGSYTNKTEWPTT